MRPADGHRKLYEKDNKFIKETKSGKLDWDFETNGSKPSVNFPITINQAKNETEPQRFERYIRQFGRCVLACSLCDRGLKTAQCDNIVIDPHFQPSIWHKEIMLIKYEPGSEDSDMLFGNIRKLLKKYNMSIKDFYRTSIIKCIGDKPTECSYFDMEWKALQKCVPKLIICFDEKSAKRIGCEYKIGHLETFTEHEMYRVYCTDGEFKLEPILKILSNPQTRNRLLS